MFLDVVVLALDEASLTFLTSCATIAVQLTVGLTRGGLIFGTFGALIIPLPTFCAHTSIVDKHMMQSNKKYLIDNFILLHYFIDNHNRRHSHYNGATSLPLVLTFFQFPHNTDTSIFCY